MPQLTVIKNSLKKVSSTNNFTGFISVRNNKDKGVIFFEKSKIINACINTDFNLKKKHEISDWNTKDIIQKKWSNDFEISSDFLFEVLCCIDIFNKDAILDFTFKNKTVKIICSEGAIIGIVPHPTDVDTFFKNILSEIKGKIKIRQTKPQIGYLKVFFTDFIGTLKKVNNKNIKVKKKEDNLIIPITNKNNKNQLIMNTKLLKKAVETLKGDLDGALIACDIWITGTGQSVAGYNPNPKATALFEQVTTFMEKTLQGAGFPGLDKYYLIELEGNAVIVVLQFEKMQWGMLVNSEKVNLGLLLNIAVPNAREALNAAI